MGVIILANAVSVGLEVQYSQGTQAFGSLQEEPARQDSASMQVCKAAERGGHWVDVLAAWQ